MKKISARRKSKDAQKDSSQEITVAGQSFEGGEMSIKRKRLIPSTKYSHREISGKLTHHALSFILPIAIYAIATIFYISYGWTLLIGTGLILLSKWQIFIVKPRFWWANLKFSAIDLIFKLSIFALLLLSQVKISSLVTKNTLVLSIFQVLLVGLYLFWNIHLRKQTSAIGMRMQALLAQFLALTSIAWTSGFSGPTIPVSAALMLSWVVTYSAAQHTLFAYEESAIPQIASFWALFATSLSFLQLIWAQNFLFFNSLLYIPLMPFVVSAFAVLAARTHAFIEDKQSDQDVPKVQVEREKQSLNKQGAIAIATSLTLAFLIILR